MKQIKTASFFLLACLQMDIDELKGDQDMKNLFVFISILLLNAGQLAFAKAVESTSMPNSSLNQMTANADDVFTDCQNQVRGNGRLEIVGTISSSERLKQLLVINCMRLQGVKVGASKNLTPGQVAQLRTELKMTSESLKDTELDSSIKKYIRASYEDLENAYPSGHSQTAENQSNVIR
jgi:hypothetical protein